MLFDYEFLLQSTVELAVVLLFSDYPLVSFVFLFEFLQQSLLVPLLHFLRTQLAQHLLLPVELLFSLLAGHLLFLGFEDSV